MRRIFAVIAREWRENTRQRWLLVTLAAQFGILALGATYVLGRVDWLAALPNGEKKLEFWSENLGMPLTLTGLTGLAVQAMDYLVLTQLLGMTAVIAGHAALHDRQCGTLPFLLLAPIRRVELLVGKVLGALSVPLAVYLVIGGATLGWVASYPVTAPVASMLPPSPGWLVAFFLGAPAWSACIGALCVAVSSLASDVRTAQQAAWVLVFLATFVVGPLLVSLMPYGAVVQLVVAGIGLGLAAIAVLLATLIVSRELGR
ncbi:MAG TPA: ABC transporter permease subunit [Myxococcota bacterium]|nr:ABC transporter permease subunit [Myxococcota bacterium]